MVHTHKYNILGLSLAREKRMFSKENDSIGGTNKHIVTVVRLRRLPQWFEGFF